MEKSTQHISTFFIYSAIDEVKIQVENISTGNYAGVILHIETNDFLAHNIPLLIELFAQKQWVVIGVRTSNVEILEFAKFSNIAIFDVATTNINTSTNIQKQHSQGNNYYPQKAPSIIRANVGNNEQIYAKECDLVITQDVSDNADVMSDKNISIYGGGYGKVFAGINDSDAFIFVAYFQLKLVCINGIYKKFSEIPKDLFNKSVVITLENGALKFIPL